MSIRKNFYKLHTHAHGFILKKINRKYFTQSGKLIADRGVRIILEKNAHVAIGEKLTLNGNSIVRNGRSSILRLDENAKLIIENTANIYYGADIIIFKNGIFKIGNTFINSDSRIRCHREITIGNDCAISHGLVVMDSDAHALNGSRHIAPVKIEDHVWIGTQVTILAGVTIGKGAVIAAGSLVNTSIPPNSLAAGVPAKVIKTDIKWEM